MSSKDRSGRTRDGSLEQELTVVAVDESVEELEPREAKQSDAGFLD